jgi:hypothetical protein
MNADRLHSLAVAIQHDLKSTSVVAALQRLLASLQNQVNAPQEPSHQQQVSAQLKTLATSLKEAPSNRYPPIWKQPLLEMRVQDLLGEPVLQTIQEIFQRNQITASVALEEIRKLHQRLEQFQATITSLITSFGHLNIGREDLEPGQVELGVLIPRDAVDNKLLEFAQELNRLHKHLGVFAELALGQREGFPIRAIASTDLMVFLDLAPKVGACLAVAIERSVALYRQLLEIRKLRTEMSQQGIPDTALAKIDDHANQHMTKGLEPLVEELLAAYWKGKDGHRRNELANELRIALNAIANRIDDGYNLEVRAGSPPAAPEGGEADASTRQDIEQITNSAAAMQFLRPAGDPILQLPESTQEGGDDDEQERAADHDEKRKGKR